MWGYQQHFLHSLQYTANNLFMMLSPKLDPKVILVGKLDNDSIVSHSICFEPETAFKINIFDEFDVVIDEISQNDPEKQLMHTHPKAAANHRAYIKGKSIRDAVLKIIENSNPNRIYFCSFPQRVKDYQVIVLLSFDKGVYDSFYHLKKKVAIYREKAQQSLIESASNVFLNEAEKDLKRPDPVDYTGKNSVEILISAGKCLMRTPAWYASNFDYMYNQDLYDAINDISLNRYEGSEAIGNLIVTECSHPNVNAIFRLLKPLDIKNPRAIRKLLEISNNNLTLFADSNQLYALGTLPDSYGGESEDLYKIQFNKHHSWSLIHNKDVLMKVENLIPSLPRDKISKEKVISNLKRIFWHRQLNLAFVKKLSSRPSRDSAHFFQIY